MGEMLVVASQQRLGPATRRLASGDDRVTSVQ